MDVTRGFAEIGGAGGLDPAGVSLSVTAAFAVQVWTKQANSNKSQDRAVVQQKMRHWQQDTDLAGVRGDALAKLPAAEREPWRKLWEEVDGLLAKVGASEKK
jgi:hypothetical protein